MSKADEIRARERYMNDPFFHNTVCLIRQLITETRLSPNELHDAVNLAADQVNSYHPEYVIKAVEFPTTP